MTVPPLFRSAKAMLAEIRCFAAIRQRFLLGLDGALGLRKESRYKRSVFSDIAFIRKSCELQLGSSFFLLDTRQTQQNTTHLIVQSRFNALLVGGKSD